MFEEETIAIIGTGNFGIALGKRLVKYGMKVIYGSRKPNLGYLKECFEPSELSSVSVGSTLDAFSKSGVFIFLAVPFGEKVYEDILADLSDSSLECSKILIELSNRLEKSIDGFSNAEKLFELLNRKRISKANVVKGFNLTNAYSMSLDFAELKGSAETVQICGNDFDSKQRVIQLCSKIGFNGLDIGPLKNSRVLEEKNLATFPDWHYPSIISFLFFLFNFVWIFIHYFYFPKKPHTFQQYLDNFSLFAHTNKVLGYSALQLLAFVYLGSVIGSLYQLGYGTKYKKFPKYLDFWLKSRKHFGLLSFLFASAHCLASLCVISPAYLADWFRKSAEAKFTQLTLHGDINLLTGIVSYFLLALVALSSVNSIANSLNWSEWRFVQSNLGILGLFMANLHTASMYFVIFMDSFKFNYSTTYLLTRVKLLAGVFPLIVLLLRLGFAYLPPLYKRVEQIRSGELQLENIDNKEQEKNKLLNN